MLGDLARRREEQLLGLVDVERRSRRRPSRRSSMSRRLLVADIARPLGDLELEVERAQRQIRLRHIRDERRDDTVPRLFGREILRARRFAQPPQPSPHVELPAQAESGLRVAHARCRRPPERPGWRRTCDVRAAIDVSRDVDGRKLIGARDPVCRARLQHALGGNAHLEVLLQRRCTPAAVSGSSWNSSNHFRSASDAVAAVPGVAPAVHGRRLDDRPLVVGPERARRRQGRRQVTSMQHVSNLDTINSSAGRQHDFENLTVTVSEISQQVGHDEPPGDETTPARYIRVMSARPGVVDMTHVRQVHAHPPVLGAAADLAPARPELGTHARRPGNLRASGSNRRRWMSVVMRSMIAEVRLLP